jgi:serine/threonine protein kinase
MVDKESNHVKIIDFGLSRFFDRTACDPLSTMCGSPQYVAPEILEMADSNRTVRHLRRHAIHSGNSCTLQANAPVGEYECSWLVRAAMVCMLGVTARDFGT